MYLTGAWHPGLRLPGREVAVLRYPGKRHGSYVRVEVAGLPGKQLGGLNLFKSLTSSKSSRLAPTICSLLGDPHVLQSISDYCPSRGMMQPRHIQHDPVSKGEK